MTSSFAKQRLSQQKQHKSDIAGDCAGTTCLNRGSTIAAAPSPTFLARVLVSTAMRPITSKLNISGHLSEQSPAFLSTRLQAFRFLTSQNDFNMFKHVFNNSVCFNTPVFKTPKTL